MEWIVSRTLKDPDSGAEVSVALALPRQVADEEWTCEFRIGSSLQAESMQAHGIDGFQALLCAIEGLHFALARRTQRLTYIGGEPGDTGVPRFTPISFGLAFRQRIESLIEDEIARLGEEARRRCRLQSEDPR